MILTLQEMSRQSMEKVDMTPENQSTTVSKVYNFINQYYERIYRGYTWGQTIDTATITLVTDSQEYVVDKVDVDEILNIFDFNTGRYIDQHTLTDYLEFIAYKEDVINDVRTGTPREYRVDKELTSKASLTAADQIQVLSDDNTDLTPNCVRILGLSGGVLKSENITLTGTTAVDSVNTYDQDAFLEISTGTTNGVEKTIEGNITIREKTVPANVKAVILPETNATFYKYISISPTSSDNAVSVTVYYRKKIRPLTKFNDIPIVDCSLEIIQGVYSELLRLDGQTQRYIFEKQRFEEMVRELFSRQGRQKNLTISFYPRESARQFSSFPRSRYPWIV